MKDDTSNESKKKTQKKHDAIADIRNKKEAGKYPNQHVFKTRSGHSVVYDDSKGTESITIQHRSGSAIQFLPNGAVQMTTHNGKYDIVFGENRMSVTGANDLHVKGEGSLLVEGNYRKTIHGNVEISATGSMAFTGKNIIHTASENYSTISQTATHKVSDSFLVSSTQHASIIAKDTAIVGRNTVSMGGKKAAIEGVDLASLKSSEGKTEFYAEKGHTHEVKDGDVNVAYGKDLKQKIDGSSHIKIAKHDKKDVGLDRHRNVGGNDIKVASEIHMNGQSASQPQTAQLSFNDHAPGVLEPGSEQKRNKTQLA